MKQIVNKNAIPPIVGVPLLCLCSLTIGLSAILAFNNILLIYHVKNIVAHNVIKKRINISVLFIIPHYIIFYYFNIFIDNSI